MKEAGNTDTEDEHGFIFVMGSFNEHSAERVCKSVDLERCRRKSDDWRSRGHHKKFQCLDRILVIEA